VKAAAPRCLALSGGVGGAKLALGLANVLPPEDLLVVANTGDDFDHLGLLICPDIDTVTYTLAGVSNPETGWGRADEGWRFMETLAALGGETWFRLGDRDLALHLERTRRIQAGESLSAVTADIARRLGIGAAIAPMSDQPVRTIVETPDGALIFQPSVVPGMPDMLLGRPIIWHERSPQLGTAGDLALADLSYYLIKDGSGPFVASSEHVKFRENKTVFKIFWNVDGQPWLTAPFKQEGGYEVSPFVALGAAG